MNRLFLKLGRRSMNLMEIFSARSKCERQFILIQNGSKWVCLQEVAYSNRTKHAVRKSLRHRLLNTTEYHFYRFSPRKQSRSLSRWTNDLKYIWLTVSNKAVHLLIFIISRYNSWPSITKSFHQECDGRYLTIGNHQMTSVLHLLMDIHRLQWTKSTGKIE